MPPLRPTVSRELRNLDWSFLVIVPRVVLIGEAACDYGLTHATEELALFLRGL